MDKRAFFTKPAAHMRPFFKELGYMLRVVSEH